MWEDSLVTSSVSQIQEPIRSIPLYAIDSDSSSLLALTFLLKDAVDSYLKAQEAFNEWLRQEHQLDLKSWLSQRLSEDLLKKISNVL